MAETDQPLEGMDPNFYGVIGNIASDWALLEYLVNQCIWRAAFLDEQLGACITAQIFSFRSRLEALVLLLRAREVSPKLLGDVNKFVRDAQEITDARNRAVHDPIGTEDDKHIQLQITGRGKLVFDMREVTLKDLFTTRDKQTKYLERFVALSSRIASELSRLQYTPTSRFPQITRERVGALWTP
jgi:hypothetical protein